MDSTVLPQCLSCPLGCTPSRERRSSRPKELACAEMGLRQEKVGCILDELKISQCKGLVAEKAVEGRPGRS